MQEVLISQAAEFVVRISPFILWAAFTRTYGEDEEVQTTHGHPPSSDRQMYSDHTSCNKKIILTECISQSSTAFVPSSDSLGKFVDRFGHY